MKLIRNKLCRRRYKFQTRIRRWFWKREKIGRVNAAAKTR